MTISTTRTPRGHATAADLVNQIPNPSFEVDSSYWVDTGGYGQFNGAGTLARVQTAFAFSGSADFEKNWTTAASVNNGFAGIATSIPWNAGVIKTVSGFMSSSATDQQAYIHIDFLNTSGTVIGTYDGARQTLNAAWTRLTATATAPTNTTAAKLSWWISDSSPGHAPMKVRYDGMMVTDGQLISYFDGDTPTGADGRAYGWSGTPHASNSYSYPPDPASSITPTLYQLPQHGAVSKNVLHELLGGGAALILRDAAAPDGVLRFYFASGTDAVNRAAAYNCLEQHRKTGTWVFVDDDNPQARMQYMVTPGGRLQITPTADARKFWVDIPYRKLSDA